MPVVQRLDQRVHLPRAHASVESGQLGDFRILHTFDKECNSDVGPVAGAEPFHALGGARNPQRITEFCRLHG